MEAFDISFYVKKTNDDERIIELLDTNFEEMEIENVAFIQEKRKVITRYDYTESDLVMYCVAFFGVEMTHENFYEIITFYCEYVTNIFKQNQQLELASGIYELSVQFFEEETEYNEVKQILFDNFPLVFINRKNDVTFERNNKIIYSNDYLDCVYNDAVQCLFSSICKGDILMFIKTLKEKYNYESTLPENLPKIEFEKPKIKKNSALERLRTYIKS